MLTEPVVVLGTPRSGTSLTAGLLAMHGVWTGECREPEPINPKGFFENEALRELRLKDDLTPESVARVLWSQGYSGGPWLAKHTPGYVKAWRAFKPLWVLVRRSQAATLQSRMACGKFGETPAQARRRVVEDNRTLDRMKMCGGIEVFPERFVKGDYAGLVRVLELIGLDFDREAAERFAEPDLWHN